MLRPQGGVVLLPRLVGCELLVRCCGCYDMKKTICILLLPVIMLVAACHNDSEYNLLPPGAATFITQYWPDPYIESVTKPDKDETQVIVKDGPTITFNSNNEWIEIDGNGMPLPQVLLFDQLPRPLYSYLESGEYLNEVFEIERDARRYEVEILNGDITYDIATTQITEKRD